MLSFKAAVCLSTALLAVTTLPAAALPVLSSVGWSVTAAPAPAPWPAEASFYAPQIAGAHNRGDMVFNHAVLAYTKKLWSQLGGPAHAANGTYLTANLALSWSQNANSVPAVLSITFTNASYPSGPGTGWVGSESFNWLVNAHRQITPADIFARGKPWQPALAAAALNVFQQSAPGALPAAAASLAGMEALAADPQSWVVTPSGLQISCGSLGNCNSTALIPWPLLAPYLSKHGLAAAYIPTQNPMLAGRKPNEHLLRLARS